jgi:hypothetical protein
MEVYRPAVDATTGNGVTATTPPPPTTATTTAALAARTLGRPIK